MQLNKPRQTKILTPQQESVTLCLQEWENVLVRVHWEGGVLTGSMTSTFLTDGSGATVGQSESSWYPVALLLRLWERVPSWKRSRSERRWDKRGSKTGNKSRKMKKKNSECTKAGGTSGGVKRKKKKSRNLRLFFFHFHTKYHRLFIHCIRLRAFSLSSN